MANHGDVVERKNNGFPAEKPPFIGRYYLYNNKKYLFTHRHPKRQAYWCEEYGWVPTEKLKPCTK